MPHSPAPFEIAGCGSDAVASAPGITVAFAVAGEGQCQMFRRRAIKRHPDGAIEAIEAVVAELDGVRAYVRREGEIVVVILSRDDLYP